MTTSSAEIDRLGSGVESEVLRCGCESDAAITARIWSPVREQMDGILGERLALCLAEAFSSRGWLTTPMPVGDPHDPNSARGIISELRSNAEVVVATIEPECSSQLDKEFIAFVLGGILDNRLIDLYGLEEFGARPGDALLSYIGVVPAFQGSRGRMVASDRCDILPRTHQQSGVTNISALLFSEWLQLITVRACPNVFIRTRRTITPVLNLVEEHNFQYCGQFHMEFHGNKQERLVYRRSSL